MSWSKCGCVPPIRVLGIGERCSTRVGLMGLLFYASNVHSPIEIEDRALAHLHVVIGAKLRLQQGFFFSWVGGVESGGGRSTIWLHHAIQLRFVFTDQRRHQLNREWLAKLSASANSRTGLEFIRESEPAPTVVKRQGSTQPSASSSRLEPQGKLSEK